MTMAGLFLLAILAVSRKEHSRVSLVRNWGRPFEGLVFVETGAGVFCEGMESNRNS